jgi:hypothetical protein
MGRSIESGSTSVPHSKRPLAVRPPAGFAHPFFRSRQRRGSGCPNGPTHRYTDPQVPTKRPGPEGFCRRAVLAFPLQESDPCEWAGDWVAARTPTMTAFQ